MKVIVDTLQEISLKIEKIQTTSTSNNIVINPCNSTQSLPKQHSTTQTEQTAEDDGHDSVAQPDQQSDAEGHSAQEQGGGGEPDLSAQPNLWLDMQLLTFNIEGYHRNFLYLCKL